MGTDCISWRLGDECPCRECSVYVNEFGEKFEDIYEDVRGSQAFLRKDGLTDVEWAAVEKWRDVAVLPAYVVNEAILTYDSDVDELADWDAVSIDEDMF